MPRGAVPPTAVRSAPLAFALVVTVGASCRCTRSVTRQLASAVRGDRAAEASPDEPGGAGGPTVGGCAVFPPDDPWNTDVSNAPRHPRSDAIIANIAAHGPSRVHADFGSLARYGIPYRTAPRTQEPVAVTFDEYGDESDPGPYPIPLDAPIEHGRDHHVIVVQQGTCKLFELYHARRTPTGWLAGAGAVFDLAGGTRRPRGWTSTDQAGLPILPGLARYNEVGRGAIRHALRVTFDHTRDGWIAPANHPGGTDDADAPPMGMRLRLKRSFDVSRFRGQTRVILDALQRYGLMTADTGTNWYISGAPDPRWDPDDLDTLAEVPASAFEVVDTGPVQRR